MKRVFAGGARMCVAVKGTVVAGVAVYRIYENTFQGRQLYVDDLVTDEKRRSTGVGRALLSYLEQKARAANLENLALDSGTQRDQAHKFYFREGMAVTAFHFGKRLK
jgi:GNAT superfamily N-acetyltransferase